MLGRKLTFALAALTLPLFCTGIKASAQLMEVPEPTFEFPEAEFIDGMKRYPPYMPPYAMQSGHCKFKLKLDDKANVKTVDIYFCTDFVFEPETISSIEKWDFKPELAGQTLEQVMTFKLTDEDGKLLPEAGLAAFQKLDIPKGGKDARLKHIFPPPNLGWEKLGDEIGHCCIDFSVSQIGHPFNVDVASCSQPGLELTAQDLIRNWYYAPATLNGEDVSVEGHQGVVKFFKIDKRGNILRDVNGLTPIAGVSERALDYCRKLS